MNESNLRDDGYRGIWYSNQRQEDEYRFKYSGGFATYPQQHIPIAVYAPEARKTFFCYGGISRDGARIQNMVSYYDHETGQVPRPVIVLGRNTFDAHYNPTLQIDHAGYLYIFCNSHGIGGELDKSDPTYGEAYIYKSRRPYSINGFERIQTTNFSYSQAWPVPGQGLMWLHTRYAGGKRQLFWSVKPISEDFLEPQALVAIAQGSYQISWANGEHIATALDYHPENGGLNARTNIYYLETQDFGQSWRTVDGQALSLPLTEASNPALVCDYESQGLLVYLKDLQFDLEGRPVILFLTSKSPWSGPQSGPRRWHTAHWADQKWEIRDTTTSDHNYDHGSLYIEADGTWRIIAPTLPGAQPHGTGGEIAVYTSNDEGATWQDVKSLTLNTGRNQTYVRKPWQAHSDFYALWADGNPFERSGSNLYFTTQSGDVFRLPESMDTEFATPLKVITSD